MIVAILALPPIFLGQCMPDTQGSFISSEFDRGLGSVDDQTTILSLSDPYETPNGEEGDQ